MTTIRPFAAGSAAAQRGTGQMLELKAQLDRLSTQLSTGRKAESYAGLGAGRTTSLTARASLSRLDGYDAAIGAAQTRVQAASVSVQQVTTLASDLRTSLAAGLQAGTAYTVSRQLGRTSLDAALDALGQSVAGQYLFGGRASDTAPVLSSDTILNGDPAAAPPLAGLATLVGEQKRADLGADGLGRLELGAAKGGAFRLSEDTSDATGQSRANFGFRFAGAPVATGGAITVTADPGHAAATATLTGLDRAPAAGESLRLTVDLADGSQRSFDLTATDPVPAGSESAIGVYATGDQATAALNAFATAQGGTVAGVQSGAVPPLEPAFGGGDYGAYDIALAGQPAAGDTLTVRLAMRDGTTTSLTLTAAATASAGSTTAFAIGGDAAATAANLRSTLETALKAAAAGPLAASSTTRAAQDFFSATTATGQAPRRVDPGSDPPTYAATAGTQAVIWYRGEATDTDPRQSATARAGAGLDVAVGARADEGPFQRALAGFAALAIDGFSGTQTGGSDPTYGALATRVRDLLGAPTDADSLEAIATDLGVASNALAEAGTRNVSARNALQTTVEGIEGAPLEEVAAQLLTVQNRLQASYQITASLSKLSLINYL